MKIIVVDDHKMFRESVLSFIEREPFCDRIDAAGSVEEAQRLIVEHEHDVALVDLSFPGQGGTELAKWAQSAVPGLSCLFVSMHEELSDLRSVITAAGRGYVTKNAGYGELRAAIMTVGDGGLYLDQVILRKLFAFLESHEERLSETAPALSELTAREREVVEMLLREMTTAQIGDALFISAKTVENHRSNVYRKLNVHDRMSLFRFAQTHGLLDVNARAASIPSDE